MYCIVVESQTITTLLFHYISKGKNWHFSVPYITSDLSSGEESTEATPPCINQANKIPQSYWKFFIWNPEKVTHQRHLIKYQQ